MDTAFALIHSGLIGIGLAASCGIHVLVPMLVMSVPVKAVLLQLTDGRRARRAVPVRLNPA